MDLQGRGRKEIISDLEKAWMLHVASTNPRDLGQPFDIWSMEKLSRYFQSQGPRKGYSSLLNIQKGTVCKILKTSNVKPFKIRYFMESKDPKFEIKMNQILVVYKQVDLYLEKKINSDCTTESTTNNMEVDAINRFEDIAVVSYDEKPGVQILENTRKDFYPLDRNGTILF